MPRKKIGVSWWGCSLPTEAKEKLSSMLEELGYTYAGSASLSAFLKAIYSGELEIRKKIDIGVDS